MSWRRRPTRDMIGSAQSAQLVNCVILNCHTACHAPPDVTILRMHISSESLFPPFPKRLALRMDISGCFGYFWVYPIFQASENMGFPEMSGMPEIWGNTRHFRWPDSRWFSKLDRVGSGIGKMSGSGRESGTCWSLVKLSDPPPSEAYQELRVRDSGSNVHCWRSKTNYRV